MPSRLLPKGYVLSVPQRRTFFIRPVYSQKIKLMAVLHANAGVPPVAHAYPRARHISADFSCHRITSPRCHPPRKTYSPNNPAGYIAGHTPRTHARCPFCHAGNVPTALIDAQKPSTSRTPSPPVYPASSSRKLLMRHPPTKKPPALGPGASWGGIPAIRPAGWVTV